MSDEKSVFNAPTLAIEPEQVRKSERIVTTMADWGQKLPIGIPASDGTLNKGFTTRVWKTRDERALAKLKKPEVTIGKYVAMVVAHMCNSIGDIDLSSIEKIEERLVHVSRMYMGDVFFLYCWLRHESMGDDLKMSVTCPGCSKKMAYTGDLMTTEVATVNDIASLRWEYVLVNPFSIRGKEVKKLQMTATRWTALLDASSNGNEGDAKVAALRSSIVSLNDEPDVVVLGDSELDEMSKRDLEALASELDERYMGPNMAVEGVCPHCQKEFRAAIDWTYSSFFGGSSK